MDKKKIVSVMLTDQQISELNEISEKKDLSRSYLVRRAVEDYIKRHQDEKTES